MWGRKAPASPAAKDRPCVGHMDLLAEKGGEKKNKDACSLGDGLGHSETVRARWFSRV